MQNTTCTWQCTYVPCYWCTCVSCAHINSVSMNTHTMLYIIHAWFIIKLDQQLVTHHINVNFTNDKVAMLSTKLFYFFLFLWDDLG